MPEEFSVRLSIEASLEKDKTYKYKDYIDLSSLKSELSNYRTVRQVRNGLGLPWRNETPSSLKNSISFFIGEKL